MKSAMRMPIAKPFASGERRGGTATNCVSQSSSFMIPAERRISASLPAMPPGPLTPSGEIRIAAEAYRNGRRISTGHVDTVNQLPENLP
jgi:hypothetical protein